MCAATVIIRRQREQREVPARRMGMRSGSLIMKPALRNLDRLSGACAGDAINQTVLVSDPSRPPTFVVAAQRLWFAKPRERLATRIFDKTRNLQRQGWVFCDPIKKAAPAFVQPKDPHSAASRWTFA